MSSPATETFGSPSGVTKMSKTRALKQLKTIEDRLRRAYDRTHFVTVSRRGKQQVLRDNIEKSGTVLQSCKDLIAWRDAIKRAILISNATEIVEIEGLGKFPVAYWIEKKTTIASLEGALLKNIRNEFNECKSTVERETAIAEGKLTRLLESQFGGSEKETSKAAKQTIVDTFWDQWKVQIVDTFGVENLIKKLEARDKIVHDEINTALQEHNAQCILEVANPSSIVF